MIQCIHRIEQSNFILSLTGDLNSCAVNDCQQYIYPFLMDENLTGFVINFAQVGFMGTSGIQWLINTFKELQLRQAGFALCELSDSIYHLLGMTGLDALLNIYPTEKDALYGLRLIGAPSQKRRIDGAGPTLGAAIRPLPQEMRQTASQRSSTQTH